MPGDEEEEITAWEVRSTAAGLNKAQKAEIRAAFNMFDEDGDGAVSVAELTMAMQALGQNPAPGQAEAMIDEFDEDASGTIDIVRAAGAADHHTLA